MGQYWNVIDIDNQVQIEYLGKIGEGLFREYDARVFSAIMRHPIKETPILVPYLRRTTGLLRLPPELILEIIGFIKDFIDAVALVMTNKMIYTLGFKSIQRRMVRISAPCIGSRILCLGDGIKWGRSDLPPGITAKDWEDVMENPDEDDENDYNYYDFARDTFGELERGRLTFPFFWAILTLDNARKGGLGDDRLVLCNLTKRVYVDGGKAWELVKTSLLRTDDGIPCLLESILKCHICWSSDSGMSLFYEGELHRGAWAADRFEITTKDKFMAIKPFPGGAQDDWKDVTEEAMELTNNVAIAEDN